MTDFSEIYETYFRDIYRFCRSLGCSETLAEELTQETFFKALQKIDGFHGKCSIRVWLCQIAKNSYFSYYRRQKKLVPKAPEGESCENMEQALADNDTAFQIHRQLHCLEEPYKEVFTLRLFGELPFAQIARLFGKTESWARVTYHRAQIKLKERLE